MLARRFIKNDPQELAAYIKSLASGLVAFDGRMQAGKTPLAKEMAKLIPCAAVDVDCFLDKDQKKFFDALRLNELRQRVEESLASSSIVVMSGVCAQQVVERAGLLAIARVWIERTSEVCLETDARDFDGDHHADTSREPPYPEIEAYIKAYDARRKLDVIYMNAYAD